MITINKQEMKKRAFKSGSVRVDLRHYVSKLIFTIVGIMLASCMN